MTAKFQIELVDEQTALKIDFERMKRVVTKIFTDAGYDRVTLEIAVVESAPMHEMNVQFLGHDYPTDVLAFPLEDDAARGRFVGNIVVCSDVAIDLAKDYNWSAEDELLLYVTHGALHLVGYDDHAPEDAPIMHAKEREYLAYVGVDASHSREGE